MAGGELHSIALRNDGTVRAWGRNRYGQLGDGTDTDRLRPIKVGGLDGVTKISAGESHNLALKSDGSVWGWGSNNFGELGIGSFDDHINTPRMVQPLFHNRVSAIAAGQGFGFSLAVEAGPATCGLGATTTTGNSATVGSHRWALRPMEIPNFDGVIAVAAGRGHCWALKRALLGLCQLPGRLLQIGEFVVGVSVWRCGLPTHTPTRRTGAPKGVCHRQTPAARTAIEGGHRSPFGSGSPCVSSLVLAPVTLRRMRVISTFVVSATGRSTWTTIPGTSTIRRCLPSVFFTSKRE